MINEYKDEVVNINGSYLLEGTLTIPTKSKGKYPAVLIIPGTGKSNRDGNGSKINLNLYKDLAEIITSLGFVTLRYVNLMKEYKRIKNNPIDPELISILTAWLKKRDISGGA